MALLPMASQIEGATKMIGIQFWNVIPCTGQLPVQELQGRPWPALVVLARLKLSYLLPVEIAILYGQLMADFHHVRFTARRYFCGISGSFSERRRMRDRPRLG